MGFLDLGDLPRQWAELEAVSTRYAEVEATWSDRGGLSSRAIDERLTAGHRGYMAAHRCLSAAMDNHEALLAVLEHHGATNWAPWNLLRPTFEAAFYAAWLMEPDDTLTRRQRGLRFEWLDELEHRKHYANLRKLPMPPGLQEQAETQWASHEARIKDHDAIYRGEAESLGLTWPLARSVNVTAELGSLGLPGLTPESRRVALLATWGTLSGLQHGRASTLLRGMDRTDGRRVLGGSETTLTISDKAFVSEATVTCTLHRYALTLAVRRHASPGVYT